MVGAAHTRLSLIMKRDTNQNAVTRFPKFLIPHF